MSNSGQNFLNLLFGGAEQGINQFRRDRERQTDLLMTLQQMMQRQREAQSTSAFREREFNADEAFRQAQLEFQQKKDTADRMTRAGEFYWERMAEFARNKGAAENRASLAAYRKALTEKAERQGTDNKPDRAALSSLLSAALRDPASYEAITPDQYEGKDPIDQSTYQPVFDTYGMIKNYRRLSPAARGRVEQWTAALEAMGGIDQNPFAGPPRNTFAAPNPTSLDDMVGEMEDWE